MSAKPGRKPIPIEQRKKPQTFAEKYPILYYEEGVPIRAMNVISIYISEPNMVKIAKARKGHSISIAKIIAISSQPCARCKDETITIFKDDRYISIPKGLLSSSKTNSGRIRESKPKK